MKKVNFGCGLMAPQSWVNYDASPVLRVQRFPVFGSLAKSLVKPRFPDAARFGDIARGLPEATESVDFVYCSHILEHLSLTDYRRALKEVFRILKRGGVFRGVLPDLDADVRSYLADPSADACSTFMRSSHLGLVRRPRDAIGRLRGLLGNSQHLWMWDYKGMEFELEASGFLEIRRAVFNDSAYPEFEDIEEFGRWDGCLGFECRKG